MTIDPERNSNISCLAHGDQGIHIKYLNSEVLENFSVIILQEGDNVGNFVGRTRPYLSPDQFKSFYHSIGCKGSNHSGWNYMEWTEVEGRFIGTSSEDSGPIAVNEFIVAGNFEHISLAIIGKPIKFFDKFGQTTITSTYRGLLAADVLPLNTKNSISESIYSIRSNFVAFCKKFPHNRTKNLNFMDKILEIITTNSPNIANTSINSIVETLNHVDNAAAYKSLLNYLLESKKSYICKECIHFNQSYHNNCTRNKFTKYSNCYTHNCLYGIKLNIWYEIINYLSADNITDLEILTLMAIHKSLAALIYGKLIKTFQDGNNAKSLKLIRWLHPIANILAFQGFKFKWKFITDTTQTYITNWMVIDKVQSIQDIDKLSTLDNLKDFTLNSAFRDKLIVLIGKFIEEIAEKFEQSVTNRDYWSNILIICAITRTLKLTELEYGFETFKNMVSKIVTNCPTHYTNQCLHVNHVSNNNLSDTYKLIMFVAYLINDTLQFLIDWQKILHVALFSLSNPSELTRHLYNDTRYLRYEFCNLTGLLLPTAQAVNSKNAFKHGPNKIVNYFSKYIADTSYIVELKSFLWAAHKYEIAEEIITLSEGKSVASILAEVELAILNSTHKLFIETQRNYYLSQVYHLILLHQEDNFEDLLHSDDLCRFLIDGCFSNNPTTLVISSRVCEGLGIDGDNKLGTCWLDDLDQSMDDQDNNSLIRLLVFGKFAMNNKFSKSPLLVNAIKSLLSYLTNKNDTTVVNLVTDLIGSIIYNLENSLANGDILRPMIDSFCQFINHLTTLYNDDYNSSSEHNHIILHCLEILVLLRSKKLLIASLLFQIPEMFLNNLMERECDYTSIPVSAWTGFCLKNVFIYSIKLLIHSVNLGFDIAHKLIVLCLMIKETCSNTVCNLHGHFIDLLVYGVKDYLSFDAEIEDTQTLYELVELMKNKEYSISDSFNFELQKQLILSDIQQMDELVVKSGSKGIPLVR